MIEIKSVDDPKIIYYKNLRHTPQTHTENKIFIAEGEKVTLKLLKSGINVISMFALPEYYEKFAEIIAKKELPDNMIFCARKEIMNEIVGFKIHKGIMAIGEQPEYAPLSSLSSPVVAMNGVIDSENVGSIVRNCAAFGIDSIIFDSSSSSPFLRRAVRVSMGAVFDMKIYCAYNLESVINRLKNEFAFSILAAELSDSSVSVDSFEFPEKFTIIFGTESKGIEKQILDACDKIIHIPISPNVASLNVAAASAVFLNRIKKF